MTTDQQDQADPTAASAVAADLADERLIRSQGVGGYLHLFLNRLKGGELGSLPVVIGLIVISLVFYSIEPRFLSSFSVTNMLQFAAPVGIIALGIVLVLLLGEIDLSVGSVSGLSAAVMAVLVVNQGWSTTAGMIAGVLTGLAIGALYAVLYTVVGVPSFVFSLAGLLGFQGALLYVLGSQGTLNLPNDSWLVQFARTKFLTGVPSYLLVVLVAAAYLLAQMYGRPAARPPISARRRSGWSWSGPVRSRSGGWAWSGTSSRRAGGASATWCCSSLRSSC